MQRPVERLLLELIRENDTIKRELVSEFFLTKDNYRREKLCKLLEAAGL